MVPPFQVPDEPSHFDYSTYLAKTGELPDGPRDQGRRAAGGPPVFARLDGLLGGGGFYLVIGHPDNRPPTGAQARARAPTTGLHLDSRGVGDASSANSNPRCTTSPRPRSTARRRSARRWTG